MDFWPILVFFTHFPPFCRQITPARTNFNYKLNRLGALLWRRRLGLGGGGGGVGVGWWDHYHHHHHSSHRHHPPLPHPTSNSPNLPFRPHSFLTLRSIQLRSWGMNWVNFLDIWIDFYHPLCLSPPTTKTVATTTPIPRLDLYHPLSTTT